MQAVTAAQWGLTGTLVATTVTTLEAFALWLPVSLSDLGSPGVVLGWGFALGGLLWFRYGIDDPVDYAAHNRRIEVTGLLALVPLLFDPIVNSIWWNVFGTEALVWPLTTVVTLSVTLALSYGIGYGLDRRLILQPTE